MFYFLDFVKYLYTMDNKHTFHSPLKLELIMDVENHAEIDVQNKLRTKNYPIELWFLWKLKSNLSMNPFNFYAVNEKMF